MNAVDSTAAPSALRQRVLQRVQRSAAASRVMHTRRHADAPVAVAAPGVTLRTLYAAHDRASRPGEPQWVGLVEVAAGARWMPPPTPLQRDWLVLRGGARLAGLDLAAGDFHALPAGQPCPALHSATGGLLLLREAAIVALPGESATTQRAAHAPWADFGPGIQRRVMWQRDGQAAMLYRTEPDAAVPRHAHHHDEECFMLQGDIFLDDVLLRPLDYQLAPAGTGHASVFTDTGVLLYAHGDLDLDLLPA